MENVLIVIYVLLQYLLTVSNKFNIHSLYSIASIFCSRVSNSMKVAIMCLCKRIVLGIKSGKHVILILAFLQQEPSVRAELQALSSSQRSISWLVDRSSGFWK
jgi:hypothetical protein